VLFSLLATPAQAQSGQLVFNPIEPDRIVALWGLIEPETTVWAETANLSPGADTVLHVWHPDTGQEIAFNDDIAPGNLASRVEVTNPNSTYMWVIIVMRARSSETFGTADLHASDGTHFESLPVEGTRFDVPCNDVEPYILETALQPNGVADTALLAFQTGEQNLHGCDLDYGVGKASRIEGLVDACEVILGVPWMDQGTALGHTALYVNDWWTDQDGDGLGHELEEQLGTCDSHAQQGCGQCAEFGCGPGQVFNLQDTDRDGLPDFAEVFGIDSFAAWGGPPQTLPKWGADPLHKDMFIQIDWDTEHGSSSPMTPSKLRAAIAYFDEASALEILNPDGEPGLRVHIDASWSSTDPDDATLFGWWGSAAERPSPPDGSGSNFQETYRDLYLPTVRRGVFRYAFAQWSGSGRARVYGDALRFNGNSVPLMAHETGHSTGIWHHGHNSWGKMNCKPHYQSTMNYAYQNTEPFSHGQWTAVLNPADVDEFEPVGSLPASFGEAFNFGWDSGSIDWNRDTVINAGPVRAPVTSGQAGCNAFAANRQIVRDGQVDGGLAASTPSLVRLRENLYVFYVTSPDLQIRFRRAKLGPASLGSCMSDEEGADCLSWSEEQTIPTPSSVVFVAATNFRDDGIALVYSAGGQLRSLHSTQVNPQGVVTSWSSEIQTSASSWTEPEIAFIDNGYGSAEGVLVIFFADPDGSYKAMWAAAPAVGGWSEPFDLFDDTWEPMEGAKPPSVTSVPRSHTEDDYCGTFVDVNDLIRLYCLHPGTLVWSERGTALTGAPTSAAKATVSFHINRTAVGSYVDNDPTNGHLYVITDGGVFEGDRVPKLRLLRRMPGSGGMPDFEQAANLWFGARWFTVKTTTSFAIYDDRVLGATKAAIVRPNDSVHFLPLADGAVRAELRDGNDFQIMERGLCMGLRFQFQDGHDYCGNASTSVWGY
jgi:hypothetical protein